MLSKRMVYIYAIVALALILRLYTAFAAHELPLDDALEYDKLAVSISSGRGFSGADGVPTSFRPPLYPFMLSGIYTMFGHSYLSARIIQAFLGALTVYLFYLIGQRLFSEKVGLAAAIAAAVYPGYVMLTKFMLTETLFTFLLALCVFIFLKLLSRESAWSSGLLGISFGCLTLTRPSAVLLPVVCATLLVLLAPKGKARRAIFFAFIVMAVYAATLLPWIYRNTTLHGRPVMISTNGGLNFYQSVSPLNGKIFGMVPSDEFIEKARSISNEAERDSFLFSKGVEKISNSPLAAARLAVSRFLFYWGPFDWEVQTGREYNFIYIFALPFFMVGFVRCSSKLNAASVLPAVITYFFLLIFASQGTARYRLPTDGFLFIIASYQICDILERAKHFLAAALLISAYFVFNCWVFLNSMAAKSLLKGVAEKIGLW